MAEHPEAAHAAPAGLDDKVAQALGGHGEGTKSQNPNENGNEHKKPQSPLEEIATGFKNLTSFATGLAFPYLFFPNDSEMRKSAQITAYPFAAGKTIQDTMAKKPLDSVGSMKESLIGTAMTPALAWAFSGITSMKSYVTNYAGQLLGGATAVAGLAGLQAAFIGAYTGTKHLLENYTVKGMYKELKKEFWPTVKRTWKYVLPLSALNVLWVYQFGVAAQLAYSSAMGLLFRIVGPKPEGAKLGNLVSALNPLPYVGAGLSVGKKAATNTYRGVYDIGHGFRNFFDRLSEYAPAPKPAAAPAHG